MRWKCKIEGVLNKKICIRENPGCKLSQADSPSLKNKCVRRLECKEGRRSSERASVLECSIIFMDERPLDTAETVQQMQQTSLQKHLFLSICRLERYIFENMQNGSRVFLNVQQCLIVPFHVA